MDDLDKSKMKVIKDVHFISTGHVHDFGANDECSEASDFEDDIIDLTKKYKVDGSTNKVICFLKRKKN